MEKTIGQLKKIAWKLFSEWIRRRYADHRGFVRCVTCGAVKHWKCGDAGHFLPGRNNSILFDERGVHFQCKQCNGHFRVGTTVPDVDKKYKEFMLKEYGPEVVKELRRNKTKTKKFSRQELENLIAELKQKISTL